MIYTSPQPSMNGNLEQSVSFFDVQDTTTNVDLAVVPREVVDRARDLMRAVFEQSDPNWHDKARHTILPARH